MTDAVVDAEPVEAALDDLPFTWVLGMVVIGAVVAGTGTLVVLGSLHG
jgi:hypothetical protein